MTMSMFHCQNCWETPCLCNDAHSYRHLSTNELTQIRDALNKLIDKRVTEGGDPNKRHFGQG